MSNRNVAAVAIALLATTAVHAQVLADSRADWDGALNPLTGPPQGHPSTAGNGAWFYEHAFTASGGGEQIAVEWDPVTGTFGPHEISRDGQSCGARRGGAWASSVRKWQSGVTARVRLTGRFRVRDSRSDGMDFWIRVGGAKLYQLHIAGGDMQPHDFEFRFWVATGLTVEVVAGPYRSNEYDGADAWWKIERSSEPLVALQLDGEFYACAEYSSEPRTGLLSAGATAKFTVRGGQGPFWLLVSGGLGPSVALPGLAYQLDLDPASVALLASGSLTVPGTAGCGKYSQTVSVPVPGSVPPGTTVALQAIASTTRAPVFTPGFSRPLLVHVQ